MNNLRQLTEAWVICSGDNQEISSVSMAEKIISIYTHSHRFNRGKGLIGARAARMKISDTSVRPACPRLSRTWVFSGFRLACFIHMPRA